MAQNPATSVTVSDCEVMSSLDDGPSGEWLVIAELCRDDAYLEMHTGATVDVDDWR